MKHYSESPKTNSLLLPSTIYKQFIALTILLLVTSSASQSPLAKYECPHGCECNETDFSARCDNLEELITSFSRKQHESQPNFMPIKSLDLSNNQLTKLTNQLELLVNLTELNLSHNQLTQVHKLNFDKLEKLDLSHNRITSAKLKKLPKNVIHLNLAHNEITYLPVDFMKLKKLRSLELVGNPLNCTCNTLHVRNWITLQHVWSDNHILCTSPVTVKGQPWLQARQTDICIEPTSTTTQRSKYNWDNYEDDNEIMMGDQPQEDPEINVEGDTEYDDENIDAPSESEKATEDESSVEDETQEKTPVGNNGASENTIEKDENIWDSTEKPEENAQKSEEDETNDDDVKTDDDGLIPVSQEPEHQQDDASDVNEINQTTVEGSGDSNEGSAKSDIEDGTENSGDGSGGGYPPNLNIFEDDVSTEAAAVQKGSLTDANAPDSVVPTEDVAKASSEDNSGTYILLGILALCLISLMAFVAMKNRKEKNRNRRYDVEKNGATELQDMDKRLLGKPLDKNGNGKATEHAPLINEYPVHKEDVPSTYTSLHPPEITIDKPKASSMDKNKSQDSSNENIPNGNGHVEPIHQSPKNGLVPKVPDSDEEVFHPANSSPEMPGSLNVSPEPPKRYSPIYTSQSPRSDRYSPVYSPETGRVKIKLTETPKPKTPVVVTRSRSRAGDYVNTPN